MVGESRSDDGNALTQSRQSFEVTFALLSDSRRRYVIAHLTEQEDTLPLADLAKEVAIREQGRPITEISDEAVRAVETTLHHSHIPKLVDAGVVEYEPDRTVVTLTETPDQFERFIALTPDGG